jgi:uncharacterized membrane protein YphA (DoxX/SURF4 family)
LLAGTLSVHLYPETEEGRMSRWNLRQIPARVATGAYILSSGLDKRTPDEQTVAGLHGFAGSVYPFLKKTHPPTFVKLLSTAEIGVGAALLLPFVPTAVAGAALTGFSAGLVGLYLRTPAMRRGANDLRPSPDGLALSKDIWMLGSGLTMLLDGLASRKKA